VIFFTTKLFKLSLSLCAPASDEFQLTIVVITRLKARRWWGKSSGSVGGIVVKFELYELYFWLELYEL